MKKRARHVPLSFSILIGSLGPFLIISIFFSVAFVTFSKKNANKNLEEISFALVSKLNSDISLLLNPFEERIDSLAEIASSNHEYQFIYNATKSLVKSSKNSFSLYYATEKSRFSDEGFYVDSDDWVPEDEWNPPSRPWFQKAKKRPNEIIFTDPYYDSMTDKLCVTISKAVLNKDDNHFQGAVAADLILDSLTDMLKDFHVSENSSTYITDEKGVYFTNDDTAKLMKVSFFDENKIFADYKDSNLDKTNGAIIKGDRYFLFSPIKDTPWFSITEGPVSDFEQGFSSMFATVMFISGILFIAVAVFILCMVHPLSKAFKFLASSCEKISKGDFTTSYNDFLTTEASILSKGFDSFSENISKLVQKIRVASSNITNISDSISQTSSSITVSSEIERTSISQVNQTIKEQSSYVSQIISAVEMIVAQTDNLSNEINIQNSMTLESTDSVEWLLKNSTEVTSKIQNTTTQVNELVESSIKNKSALIDSVQQIQGVKNESSELLEINEVISSVAEQTNLLAMNAAIEAAHAGEAGKGFSVVADEIRSLAEMVSEQAKSSGDYLKSIQNKIDGIAESSLVIEEAYEQTILEIQKIAEIVHQLLKTTMEQGEKSNLIQHSLDSLRNTTRHVQENANIIADSTTEASKICQTLSKMNEDLNSDILACSYASEKITKTSEKVSNIANDTQCCVKELVDAISHFRIRNCNENLLFTKIKKNVNHDDASITSSNDFDVNKLLEGIF